MKSTFLSATVGLLALVAIASAQDSAGSTAAVRQRMPAFNAVPVGKPAPDFTAFTPSGEKVTLSQFKGKVVILDFWASWCGPCQVSMPGLEKVYQQIKDQGVVVLSLDTWDQKPDFAKWITENSGTKYHFNFVRDPAEGDHAGIRKDSIAKRQYNVIGIPTMYIIDRDGKVAGSLLGARNEAKLVKLLGTLNLKAEVPTSK